MLATEIVPGPTVSGMVNGKNTPSRTVVSSAGAACSWMTVGLLWFLLAIAIAPTNKLYQQGLVVFLWLFGLGGATRRLSVGLGPALFMGGGGGVFRPFAFVCLPCGFLAAWFSLGLRFSLNWAPPKK